METPPPYYAPIPQKKTPWGLIIGIIVGVLLLCCGGVGYFIFSTVKKALPIAQCAYSFGDVREALRQYANEHNGALPPAATWQDDVRPYYEKMIANVSRERGPIGVMSSTGPWGCDNGDGGRTGMALNDDIAGKKFSDLSTSSETLIFEVESAVANAHDKYKSPPMSNAPKIFGQSRGWYFIRAYGEAMLKGANGEEAPVRTGPGMR